jgi:hypothetical protein
MVSRIRICLVLAIVATVVATVAGWSTLGAQSVPNACELLTDAEVATLVTRGQETYGLEPDVSTVGGGTGSLCQYPEGQVGFWIGPDSKRNFEQFIKSWQQENQPRQPVSGVGDEAYVIYPKPRNDYSDQGPYLVATVGPHTITAFLAAREGQANGMMGTICREQQDQLSDSEKQDCERVLADKGETPESLQPAVVELAKAVVAKVRSGTFAR